MKKLIYIFTTLLVAGNLSCTKLDENPYSIITTDQFYQTPSDALAALSAAYAQLVEIYNTAGTCASDFSADQIYPRQAVGRNTLTLFTYDPSYATQISFGRVYESPQQLWNSCYAGIEKSNWVIAKVPAIDMDVTARDAIVGDALFLRAFYHFTLAKNFGDVIIKIEPSAGVETAFLPTSPKAEVYTQIMADLTEAAAKLPDYPSNQRGRASRQAAWGLHAKAALYAENWTVAAQKAQEVIASNVFTLLPEIKDVFDVTKEDASRAENMWAFEAESTPPARSHQLLSMYGPANTVAPAYGKETYGSAFAYQAFFDSFDPADKRRTLLDTNYVNAAGEVMPQSSISPITPKAVLVKKYMDANSLGPLGNINVPVLRYADMYLIAAEATARSGGPTQQSYDFVNVIRTRAGLPGLTPGLGQDDFIKAILQERSWEFFGEGDRWYDLTRTNTFLQVIPLAVNDVYPERAPQARHRYFPIPQDEVNANDNLQQNPDWR